MIQATIDTQILVSPSRKASDPSTETTSDGRRGNAVSFPYAVLTVWVRGQSPFWLQQLNKSYLLRRVDGFSLYDFGIFETSSGAQKLTHPPWLSSMKEPFRAVPKLSDRPSRSRRSNLSSLKHSQSSVKASSEDTNCSVSNLPSVTTVSQTTSGASTPGRRTGYWNEYDDPTDSDLEYTVEVTERSRLLPYSIKHLNSSDSYILSHISDSFHQASHGLNILFLGASDFLVDLEDGNEFGGKPSVDAVLEQEERCIQYGFNLCVIVGLLVLVLWDGIGFFLNDYTSGMAMCVITGIVVCLFELIPLARFVLLGGGHAYATMAIFAFSFRH